MLWHTLIISALGRQRQEISEFKMSLVYMVKSRSAGLHSDTPSLNKETKPVLLVVN